MSEYKECQVCVFNMNGKTCGKMGDDKTFCFVRFLIYEALNYQGAKMEKLYIDKTTVLENLYQAMTKYPTSHIDGLETAIKIVTDMPIEAWCTDGQKRIS